jgi:hypothetical protein
MHCVAARLQPFEFSQKVIAGQRRQSPQKILNPIGFRHGTQLPIGPSAKVMFTPMEPR